MSFIESVLHYVNMVGGCIIVTLVIVVGVLYYFLKVKKIAAGVENINTSYFKKEDSISYLPFRDIIGATDELTSDGMIALSDKVFVGGISVRGFDYNSASNAERLDAQIYSTAFFNVVEQPTSFRQSIKSVDLSSNIEEHREIAKKLAKGQMELDAEYRTTLAAVEDYVDDPEQSVLYLKRIEELEKSLFAKGHQLEEVKALIEYMSALSGDASDRDNSVGDRAAQIMFSFEYNPNNYTQELTKTEIYMKAQEELNRKAASYGEALAACHFRTKRLSRGELISMFYKSSHPITGEDVSVKELLDSSYNSLFISSDSLVKAQIEKIGEDRYKEQLAYYEKQLAELLKQEQLERERTARILREESYEKAVFEYERNQEVM